ncbi:MFS transporter, partial [Nocardioides sp. YIM 152588]|uniref:MFS transporter n=1 Tax=Nocardioides sp. YIM 152588 TaxID=3158259 RepID=UPI0032E3FAE3
MSPATSPSASPVTSLVDRVLPARLGAGFRWLLASSLTTNLGDGIALAAGPLLVASQTRSPLLVSMAVLCQQLPWLLFGLYAGAIADRVDRRRLMMAANLLRALVVTGLCLTIVTGWVDITLVLVAVFLVGTAEVFVDTAAGTLLPMMVPKADLGIANARMLAGVITLNQLAGAPIGAALFAVGAAAPFGVQALCILAGVVLVSRIRVAGPPRVEGAGPTARSHVRRDIAEGLRWLWGHAAVRTLTLVILAFNFTWGAAWSVLVLYSLD